jgi:hypothetical protein
MRRECRRGSFEGMKSKPSSSSSARIIPARQQQQQQAVDVMSLVYRWRADLLFAQLSIINLSLRQGSPRPLAAESHHGNRDDGSSYYKARVCGAVAVAAAVHRLFHSELRYCYRISMRRSEERSGHTKITLYKLKTYTRSSPGPFDTLLPITQRLGKVGDSYFFPVLRLVMDWGQEGQKNKKKDNKGTTEPSSWWPD